MNKIVKIYIVALLLIVLLTFIAIANAQEFIVLENDKGVQKSSFLRGEGIVITVTMPYDGAVEVLLYNPPGTAGPSPVLFFSRTPVSANIQTKLGPKWMDEKAPCGKYQLEIKMFDSIGRHVKTEYKYFDYAMNEPPCATSPLPPPPPDNTLIIILGAAVAAVAVVVVVVVFMLRPGARPPKERVPTTPPIAPPSPPPSAPPKAPHKRRPIIRGEEEEET